MGVERVSPCGVVEAVVTIGIIIVVLTVRRDICLFRGKSDALVYTHTRHPCLRCPLDVGQRHIMPLGANSDLWPGSNPEGKRQCRDASFQTQNVTWLGD